MAAKILVVQNDFHTTVGERGAFLIQGLPPGAYVLVAWSPSPPSHEPQRRPVVIVAGATLQVDFHLVPRTQPSAHGNKYGEPYGRYR